MSRGSRERIDARGPDLPTGMPAAIPNIYHVASKHMATVLSTHYKSQWFAPPKGLITARPCELCPQTSTNKWALKFIHRLPVIIPNFSILGNHTVVVSFWRIELTEDESLIQVGIHWISIMDEYQAFSFISMKQISFKDGGGKWDRELVVFWINHQARDKLCQHTKL